MQKPDIDEFRERITGNIRVALEQIPDNPIYESHFAKAIESYLRSLEILERLERNECT